MKTAQNLLFANSLWRIFTACVIIAFSFLLIAFVSPAHALEKTTSSTPETFSNSYNSNSDVPANFHSVVQIVTIEALSAAVCQLSGYDPLTSDHKCLGVNPNTGKVGFVENGGGAIGGIGRLIDYTLIPPISSVQYIAYLQDDFGIVKNANAQEESVCAVGAEGINNNGVGFCSIEPLLDMWKVMRNIVYLILILVFVIIGMGIMLRVHIDPRTVMTLQNQIPKIIVGVIAITFSFAIAGLLIDIMWVAIYLFAGVIMSASDVGTSGTLMEIVTSDTPFSAANYAHKDGILGIAGITAGAFASIIQGAFESGGDAGVLGDLLGGIVTFITFLVVLIAIIIVLIRLWVVLILAYIYVILDIIFAPFWILAGLLPGSSMGLGAWLRDLVANLAVFPVTIGFFLLGSYLMTAFTTGNSELISRFNPPLIGGMNPTGIAALIGFGFILMMPNLLSTMKTALKAPKMSFGNLLGPISSAGGSIRAVPNRAFTAGEKFRYARGEGGSKTEQLFNYFGNPLYKRRKE